MAHGSAKPKRQSFLVAAMDRTLTFVTWSMSTIPTSSFELEVQIRRRSSDVYDVHRNLRRCGFHKERTMRTMMLAAVAVMGLGSIGSVPASAAPVYGPALSAAAETLDMTQNVWWHY